MSARCCCGDVYPLNKRIMNDDWLPRSMVVVQATPPPDMTDDECKRIADLVIVLRRVKKDDKIAADVMALRPGRWRSVNDCIEELDLLCREHQIWGTQPKEWWGDLIAEAGRLLEGRAGLVLRNAEREIKEVMELADSIERLRGLLDDDDCDVMKVEPIIVQRLREQRRTGIQLLRSVGRSFRCRGVSSLLRCIDHVGDIVRKEINTGVLDPSECGPPWLEKAIRDDVWSVTEDDCRQFVNDLREVQLPRLKEECMDFAWSPWGPSPRRQYEEVEPILRLILPKFDAGTAPGGA